LAYLAKGHFRQPILIIHGWTLLPGLLGHLEGDDLKMGS